MKTAIKLVLIYYAYQILGALIAMIFALLYTKGDQEAAESIVLTPAMLLAFIFMTIHLWKGGYINTDKTTWSPISATYLSLTAAISVSAIVLIDYILSLMPQLPDIMKESFTDLQSNGLGILSIALLGPILEELLFRGAITGILLKKYTPTKAILLSALIFGIFHINPAQVVFASFFGLLLTWIYYKSASLIPCILMHVLNNSVSVYLSLKYPTMEHTQDIFPGNTYYIILFTALLLFTGAFLLIRQIAIPFHWGTENNE